MTTSASLNDWSYEQKCHAAVAALLRNGFTAQYCATADQARDYILHAGATAASVAFGGSLSVASLDVEAEFAHRGKEILNHSNPSFSREERLAVMRRQLTSDLFLTGCNALTLSGELVNIDATGNRVAAMFFGPQQVIVVVGRNKLVQGTPQDAINRIKLWASPPNARRLGFKTPCAQSGFCSNCSSPDRICRIAVTIDRKPRFTDLHVLVVNADLGL